MNVIILGSNHNNTLGLVWSLGSAGHKVILLLRNRGNNYVSKSKYISRTYLINKGDDVIALIRQVATVMDSKPVVFVTNDDDATFLNDHYVELMKFCYFEGGRPDGSINKYRDKDEEEKLACKFGLTIPQTTRSSKPTYNTRARRFYSGQINKYGQVYSIRNCFFEPATGEGGTTIDNLMAQVERVYAKNKIVVFSTHRINYVGGIDESNRNRTLVLLDAFLTQLLKKYPDLVFLSSDKLINIFEK